MLQNQHEKSVNQFTAAGAMGLGPHPIPQVDRRRLL
jgi:hypothetical protein